MIARVQSRRSKPGGNYFLAPTGVSFFSSGCKTLDLALGGGWAKNRIINIVGDESTGKTLLCIEGAANHAITFPKDDIHYREAESAWIDAYARAIGMPSDRVNFGDGKLDTVEDFFEDLDATLGRARRPFLYMLDSLDALSDRAEQRRKADEGSYGTGKAKKLSEMFRRRVRRMEEKQCTLIIVSQVREKIGVMFGEKKGRTGGKALDFYASQVPWLARLNTITKTIGSIKRATGVRIRARVKKNKVGLPFREAEFPMKFGYGIDDVLACIEWLEAIKAPKSVVEEALSNTRESVFRETILNHDGDWRGMMKTLHQVVEREWIEIERKLLPPVSKYDNG